MNGKMLVVLGTLALLPSGARAQDGADGAFSPSDEAARMAAADDAAPLWERFAADPRGAFVASALVPGAGELLNGDESGWLFLGAEAALWAGYVALTIYRNINIEAFEDAGDAGWNRSAYELYESSLKYDPVEDPDSNFFSIDDVPAAGTDAFYDFITRPQAAPGWSDYEDYYDNELPAFDEEYRTPLQRDMKDDYDAAEAKRRYRQYTTGAMVLNHLVSAINSYRTARIRQGGGGISMHLTVRGYGGEPVPQAEVAYTF